MHLKIYLFKNFPEQPDIYYRNNRSSGQSQKTFKIQKQNIRDSPSIPFIIPGYMTSTSRRKTGTPRVLHITRSLLYYSLFYISVFGFTMNVYFVEPVEPGQTYKFGDNDLKISTDENNAHIEMF